MKRDVVNSKQIFRRLILAVIATLASGFCFSAFAGCGSNDKSENEDYADDRIFINESPGLIVAGGDSGRRSVDAVSRKPRPDEQIATFNNMPTPTVPKELKTEAVMLRYNDSKDPVSYETRSYKLLDSGAKWWTLDRSIEFEVVVSNADTDELEVKGRLLRIKERRTSNDEAYEYRFDSADIRPVQLDSILAPAFQLMIEDGINFTFDEKGGFAEIRYPEGFSDLFQEDGDLRRYGRPPQLFRSYLDEAVLELPNKEVAAGDKWNGTQIISRYGEEILSQTEYQYLGTTESDANVALIEFNRTISGEGNEENPYGATAIEQTGVYFFDLKLGGVTKCVMEEEGEFEVKGSNGGIRKLRSRVEMNVN